MNNNNIISRLLGDQDGAVPLEWSLLLAVFGIPLIGVFAMLLSTLAAHYRMMSFILSLPYP